MPRISPIDAGGTNVTAFLDTVAMSELGAAILANPKSDDGYRILCGSTPERLRLFISYADHPRDAVEYQPDKFSTAAGRYQLLARYFDYYRALLKLKDFSPISQDRIAIQQIRERKALGFIQVGRLADAVDACKTIWASLPGAGYGQRENSFGMLAEAYKAAGGTIA
jgi:muramidase (phage lysozyme)